MKKLSLLFFCFWGLVMQVFSYSFEEGGIYYNITSSTNMTVEVTSGKEKYEGWYVIPESVLHEGERYYVTAIGGSAFAGCTKLYSFAFAPNTRVKSIGGSAFSGCNSLTGISIPASVTSVGNYAFSGCMNLRSVDIEDSNTTLSLGYGSMNGSDYGLFADCPLTRFYCGRPLSYNTNYGYSPIANQLYLDDIVFGENVTTISPYMFYNNFAITSITLPETITALGDHAFDGLRGLKSYTIPEHITSIGDYAFANCTELTSFTIPEWITSIGAGTFSNCYGLTSFTIGSGVTTIGDYAFSGCSRLTSFTIPNNVNSIGNYAFKNCKGIKSLKIEKGKDVDKVALTLGYGSADGLGYGLFYDCPLESVDIQRTLNYKTSYSTVYETFKNCSPFRDHPTLKKATIGEEITFINDCLFYQARYLEEVNLPSTAETIGNSTFYGCESLASISIPASVTTFKDYAFANCTGFTSFTFGNNLTSIGNYVFSGCTGIKSLKFERGKDVDKVDLTLGYGSADGLGYGLFYDCPLESVDIQRTLNYKTSYSTVYETFKNCSPFRDHPTLKKATVGDEITYIYDNLFYQASHLEEVNLPSTAETIGSYTFYGCESLKSITIPVGMTTIKDYAFANCTGFTSFVVKPSVQSIGNYVFNGCTSMTGLVFEEGDETLTLGYNNYHHYSSDPEGKGMFFDCPLQSVFIGRNLSYNTGDDYGNSPFAKIETLTKAHFGNPLKTIQPYLFRDCKSLKTFQYNSKCAPTSVEKYAFWGCTSLEETDIVLPESVETIGEGAFRNCTSLQGYTIPNHITTVEGSAFMNCEKLAAIVVKPSVLSIGNYTFNGCTSLTGVVFEEGEETLTLGYNNYHNNSSAPEGKGMFFDCPLISTFIGRNLSYNTGSDYGNSPFAKNESLTKVHFGNPVKSIPAYLLKGCNSLTTLEYNSKCAPTTVGSYAFSGCKLLTWDDISLPLSIETIEDGAFKDCENIRSVVIKPAVKSIGNYVFNGCTKITGVVFEECEETLSLGYNNYHNNSSAPEGRGLFFDCPLISTFIGRNLSYNTGSNYGTSPFAHFSTLTSALIGNPVTRIPDYIFQGDAELNKVEFNRNCQLQSVGKYAFDGCTNLTTPQLPNTVTAFDEGAFNGCTNFMNFELPESLATIGSYTFQNCTGLTELDFPATMTTIGNYAFSGCTGVKQISFADSEGTLALGYGASKGKGYGLFNDCPLEELYLGKTVSYDVNTNGTYGYSPFYKQEALESITVGPKVTALPYCIFWGTAMEELYIPSSVRTLHSSFANNCPNLKKIIILGATPPATDTNNTMLSNSAEDSRFYVFFPDKYKTTKIWKDYANKIDACCEIYCNLTYGGDKHLIAYQTDFPIVLDNMETEAVDAGTYQKRIGVTYTTNDYTLEDVLDFEYTIKKALLTITPKSCTREYGDENPEFKFDYDGLATGEDEGVLTKDPTATTQATIKSIVGDYDIIASGAEAKNYEIQYGKGTLTIAKAPLTLTAKSYSIRQGEALPQYELEFDGFKNNETKNVLSKQPRITCEASSVSLPGTYDIIVSGAESYNYNISHVNGTLTISPYKKGDVNNDGYIDVADLTGVVHFILNESTANLVFESADLDENGAVEINDYAALVKVILGGQNNNSFMARRSPANMENLISLTLGNNGEIFVNLLEDRQFTGMQFDLMLPDGVTLAENGVESESPQHGCWSVHREDGRYSILCSSMTNAELHEGVVIRLKTDGYTEGVVTVSNVVLSDKHAHRHEAAPVQTFMDGATAISKATNNKLVVKTENGMLSLLSDKDQTVIIYGVNGVLAAKVGLSAGQKETVKLPTGVYVVNNKKIVIR